MSSINLILFDDPEVRENLLPLTYTRAIAEIRVGILTIREKWEKILDLPSSTLTQEYLSGNIPLKLQPGKINLFINGSICPDHALIRYILDLSDESTLMVGDFVVASKTGKASIADISDLPGLLPAKQYPGHITRLRHTWDIFTLNGQEILADFPLVTTGRVSAGLPESNTLIGNRKDLFIDESASLHGAIINANSGPVYIDKNAEVMEGSVIRGPFALCESSVLKLGAKVYGPTTIGPYSKVGGEVNNIVIFGYSNKGHDGFLGNSVIGEWCNLGAGTNSSNLKNNYSNVRVWNYAENAAIDSQLQFCGLIMADHSKSGINTMFNTGTVIGVSSNIFGSGFPPKFIPSFTWSAAGNFEEYKLEKSLETAARVMIRRGVELNEDAERVLKHIFKNTENYRSPS